MAIDGAAENIFPFAQDTTHTLEGSRAHLEDVFQLRNQTGPDGTPFLITIEADRALGLDTAYVIPELVSFTDANPFDTHQTERRDGVIIATNKGVFIERDAIREAIRESIIEAKRKGVPRNEVKLTWQLLQARKGAYRITKPSTYEATLRHAPERLLQAAIIKRQSALHMPASK